MNQQRRVQPSPGPWIYQKQSDVSETDGAIVTENGLILASLWGIDVDGIDDPQTEANGHVMAASLEMLKALERLEDAAQRRDNSMGDPIAMMTARADLLEAAEHARKIIKQAKGETP